MADDTITGVLDATHRALSQHDSENPTVPDIAADADTSTASIHYHYDTRNQLFDTFLDETSAETAAGNDCYR